MIGGTIGSYRVVSKLGEGGMGIVYLGEHPLIGKKVAVKMLLPELSKNEEVLKRFFNEARASTMVKHPGIVDIFDFGVHQNGSAYIVMEFLDGESLATRMRRVKLFPVGSAAVIAIEISTVLAAAHARGIVHRDLKPDNIFLVPDVERTTRERLKILDFGIAKLAADGSASLKTRTGSVMGTPTYMSPEQCRGAGEVDHRADQYSLGCILFELVSGRPPFVGEGIGEIIGAHQYMPCPALRTFAPNVNPQFEAIVMRMLAKRADERYPSMDLCAAELAPFMAEAVYAASSAPTMAVQQHPSGILMTPVPGSVHPRTSPPQHRSAPPGSMQMQAAHAATMAVQSPSMPPGATVPHLQSRPGTVPPNKPTTLGGAASEAMPFDQPPKSKKPILIAGIGVAALGAAAVAFFVLKGGGKTDPKTTDPVTTANTTTEVTPNTTESPEPSPSPSPSPVASASPEPVASPSPIAVASPEPVASPSPVASPEPAIEMVKIALAVTPADAKVTLDGKPVTLPLELPKADRKYKLVATADGYKSETREFKPLRDLDFEIALEKKRGGRPTNTTKPDGPLTVDDLGPVKKPDKPDKTDKPPTTDEL